MGIALLSLQARTYTSCRSLTLLFFGMTIALPFNLSRIQQFGHQEVPGQLIVAQRKSALTRNHPRPFPQQQRPLCYRSGRAHGAPSVRSRGPLRRPNENIVNYTDAAYLASGLREGRTASSTAPYFSKQALSLLSSVLDARFLCRAVRVNIWCRGQNVC